MTARRLGVATAIVLLAVTQAVPVAAQSAQPDEAMLPTEAQTGLKFLDPPQTNHSDDGEISSVSATYKAPPAEGEPIDPQPVCEGSGWGGAEAGYGPNLCIRVVLSSFDEPCPECYDLGAVRERFPQYAGTTSERPAPDPCEMLNSDPASPPAWPCVESTTVFPRGAEVSGFENLDRNTHMVHFRLIGAVDGIAVSMATQYYVYTSDPVVLDHMAERVRDLGAIVATQIRQTVARQGDGNDSDSGGGGGGGGDVTGGGVTGDGSANTGQPGAFPTVNDLPVEDVAPFVVISALAAIAAVAATIGATGGAVGAVAGGGGALPQVPTGASPPPVIGTFVDPDTGEVLPVENGMVWIGDWVRPEEAQKIIDDRIKEIELDKIAAAQHQDFVDAQQAIRDDQMQSQGFQWNEDSQTWVATDVTNKILDSQWLQKMANDPSWQATQQQFADIQNQINTEKKKILSAHNSWLQKEHDLHNSYAKVYDKMWVGAKAVQGVADTAINVLATVTGPAGKALKQKYTFLKTFCGELSEKGVSGQTLLTATLKGASDVGMDELGGKILPGKDFGDGPTMSDTKVTYIIKKLWAGGSTPNYDMRKHFGPAIWSSMQGEVQNFLGWRPIGDDAKTALGALSGDTGDADKLAKESTLLHLVQQKLTGTPTMIGGPL